MKEGQVELLDV
jgi:Ca2+-binding EF-hand superfamily protein